MNNEETVVTVESKEKLLRDWIALIQKDIDTMQTERDAEFNEYKKQKDLYDAWLAKRYKKVLKIEKKISGCKKNITLIEKEIAEIKSRPAPGVLPPLQDDPKPKARKISVEGTNIQSDVVEREFTVKSIEEKVDLSTEISVFTPEEKAAMNAEASKST